MMTQLLAHLFAQGVSVFKTIVIIDKTRIGFPLVSTHRITDIVKVSRVNGHDRHLAV